MAALTSTVGLINRRAVILFAGETVSLIVQTLFVPVLDPTSHWKSTYIWCTLFARARSVTLCCHGWV